MIPRYKKQSIVNSEQIFAHIKIEFQTLRFIIMFIFRSIPVGNLVLKMVKGIFGDSSLSMTWNPKHTPKTLQVGVLLFDRMNEYLVFLSLVTDKPLA